MTQIIVDVKNYLSLLIPTIQDVPKPRLLFTDVNFSCASAHRAIIIDVIRRRRFADGLLLCALGLVASKRRPGTTPFGRRGILIPPLEAASRYISASLYPVPIPYQEKAPKFEGWPDLRLTHATIGEWFNGQAQNIGLILGDDSGTADVDLDCNEAIGMSRLLLPDTSMIFGRESKPASHWFYRLSPPCRSKRYVDPVSKGCLCELRCQKTDGKMGLQTVVPPSTHPSGEVIRYEGGCGPRPSSIQAGAIQSAVAKLAAGCLLVRYWPGEGGRNQAFIALAGVLARAGWSLEDAIAFHRALYVGIWNGGADLECAAKEVRATYEKHGAGFQVTAAGSLSQLVDKTAIHSVFNWLGIQTGPQAPVVMAPKGCNVEELLDNPEIKAPELMVEGILPKRGLAVVGGRPKEGKSWFACQTALSVVTGAALGGWLRVFHPGRVHLWALEDQYALTKDKIAKLLRGARPDGLNHLVVYDHLDKTVMNGGDQIIEAALNQSPAELVILDSLFKLTGDGPSQNITQRDYDILDRLRKIGMRRNILFLIVMHTKKGASGSNPIENLLGTSGITAVPDGLVELKRLHQGAGALTVVGRSVPGETYEMKWHGGPDDWGWTICAQGEAAIGGEVQEEVLDYLGAQGATTAAAIATALRRPFTVVLQALQGLAAGHKVRRDGTKWDLGVQAPETGPYRVK